MTRAKTATPKKYGELKRPYQFYLTETLSNKIDVTSQQMGLSRSEYLETFLRGLI